MRRLPPLRSLEAFVRVARLGSAKAAADELSLSPSALSRRLAGMESFVGKKLFVRQNQQLRLNADGEALFEAAAPALDDLAEAIEAHIDDTRILRMRLGVLSLFATQRLLPALPELRRRYPLLHIDVDTSGHSMGRLGDTLDAAIVLTDKIDPGLHAVQLDRNQIYAFASKEVAAQLGDRPDPEQLRAQTFLIHQEMPLSFDAWRAAVGMKDDGPVLVDQYDFGQLMLGAASEGLGIAIMHDDHFSRSPDPRLARVFPDFKVDSPYSYWFVCRPRALELRPVRLFHDWLIEQKL